MFINEKLYLLKKNSETVVFEYNYRTKNNVFEKVHFEVSYFLKKKCISPKNCSTVQSAIRFSIIVDK